MFELSLWYCHYGFSLKAIPYMSTGGKGEGLKATQTLKIFLKDHLHYSICFSRSLFIFGFRKNGSFVSSHCIYVVFFNFYLKKVEFYFCLFNLQKKISYPPTHKMSWRQLKTKTRNEHNLFKLKCCNKKQIKEVEQYKMY